MAQLWLYYNWASASNSRNAASTYQLQLLSRLWVFTSGFQRWDRPARLKKSDTEGPITNMRTVRVAKSSTATLPSSALFLAFWVSPGGLWHCCINAWNRRGCQDRMLRLRVRPDGYVFCMDWTALPKSTRANVGFVGMLRVLPQDPLLGAERG